jgi:hypothetical protein
MNTDQMDEQENVQQRLPLSAINSLLTREAEGLLLRFIGGDRLNLIF